MSKVSSFLAQRLEGKSDKKMSELGNRSAEGGLNGISGIFGLSVLSESEVASIRELVDHYVADEKKKEKLVQEILQVSSEIKAISTQATMLHGERIRRAKEAMKECSDRMFTSWLTTVYGNARTGYNFLYYYDLYESLPKHLQGPLKRLPQKAVYTLASRTASAEEKHKLIEQCQGKTAQESLRLIRETIPLGSNDKRGASPVSSRVLSLLDEAIRDLERQDALISLADKKKMEAKLKRLAGLVRASLS